MGLPILDEPEPAAVGAYRHFHTRAWSATVAGFDEFVTPEYNHGVPLPHSILGPDADMA